MRFCKQCGSVTKAHRCCGQETVFIGRRKLAEAFTQRAMRPEDRIVVWDAMPLADGKRVWQINIALLPSRQRIALRRIGIQ